MMDRKKISRGENQSWQIRIIRIIRIIQIIRIIRIIEISRRPQLPSWQIRAHGMRESCPGLSEGTLLYKVLPC